ncbi:PHP domain-containing protein [Phototrophicus methaneseepsis]|uniref:PHP domain-containing protein n=1 Tax=Phototrophicus methaneseepsis TaxID=2710758 RepID=A0A7S8EC05_9CHLR|nr:CehA/McbA family metallohydrolase [Phototrophicus methaneseepsis]QPC84079.1 PHP domain-containing protein [Phototrophicus methaneseepsis]
MTIKTLILEGKALPEHTKTYLMLPFAMPPGAARVDVAYEYSAAIGSDPQLTGGNTVDIGIFDPRGHTFMSEGFRGWSGSARSAFYISTDDATPGYMPGPLQAGEWHVCLGTYKVADEGCDYRVTVQITLDEAEHIERHFPPRLQLSAQPRPGRRHADGWYKGELHCHTYHSDGDSDPCDVVRKAESLGLDFLAITDHNVLSQQVPLCDVETPLMLIPGMEVTTYHGHWNIWGAGGWIDFRTLSEADMQQAVTQALAQGYFVSCNHPKPYGPEWDYPAVQGFHSIEVWNGPWPFFNEQALAYWEDKLRAGEHYVVVGGSDSHFHQREHPAQLAQPTLYIYCEDDPSPAALLEALKAGHAFITEAPDGPRLTLTCEGAMMGDTLQTAAEFVTVTVHVWGAQQMQVAFCGSDGVIAQLDIPSEDWQHTLAVDVRQTPYIRAQLVTTGVTDQVIHALTNPIYLKSLTE